MGCFTGGQARILTEQAHPCSVPALIRALCLGTHWRGPPGAAGSWPLPGLIQLLDTSLWGAASLQVLPLKMQHKYHPSLPSSLGPSTCSYAPDFIQPWPSLAKLGLLMLQAAKQSPAGLVLTQIGWSWPTVSAEWVLGTGPKC